ncbi:phage tail tube protein [Kitasatospora sp. NPDC001574]
MSDLISDGLTKVVWCASLSSQSAPGAAELNAAPDYTLRITPDGLKADPSTAGVDTGSLGSTTDTEEVGRVKWDLELTFKVGSTPTEQLPYTTLTRGTHGFLVVRRDIPFATAFASGQSVEVYPVACGQRARKSPAANEVAKYSVPMKVTSEATPDAVVA